MKNLIRYSFGKIKPLKITGQAQEKGSRFASSVTPMNILIESPLETLLSALAACETATLKAISMKSNLKIGSIKFTRVESGLDLEKWKKGGSENKIEDIKLDAQIQTNVTQQELNKWIAQTEEKCPVFQILKAAGVKIESNWKNVQSLS